MKVLTSGDGRKGWSCKTTCSGAGNGDAGCGAELLVEQADLFETTNSRMDETEHFVTFKCPECSQKTDLCGGNRPPYDIIRRLPLDPDILAERQSVSDR